MSHAADHTAAAEAVESVADVATDVVTDVVSWWTWSMKILAYVQSSFISIVFFLLFVTLIIWIVKLNVGNGEYRNFFLADMVRRHDGRLDRKAVERALLFLATLYGFMIVVHKHADLIIGYLAVMAGIWLGYQVADNKLPSLGKPPGSTPDPNAGGGPTAPPAPPNQIPPAAPGP